MFRRCIFRLQAGTFAKSPLPGGLAAGVAAASTAAPGATATTVEKPMPFIVQPVAPSGGSTVGGVPPVATEPVAAAPAQAPLAETPAQPPVESGDDAIDEIELNLDNLGLPTRKRRSKKAATAKSRAKKSVATKKASTERKPRKTAAAKKGAKGKKAFKTLKAKKTRVAAKATRRSPKSKK